MIIIVLQMPIAKDKQYACGNRATAGQTLRGCAMVINQKKKKQFIEKSN